ncbi:hypothetical protein CSB95_0782 [Pseudomonas aeruginosa]|nr:hypothetical protein CSB94_3549 [Pseudomonas aeruginosa]EFQ37080.1 hypothetical protein PA39016_000110018 [Pseudomonas aeruginosa 39016]AVK14618.1 hypothetical protein CSB91_2657 [Pseudomonas aeruginosa]AWE74687.1 hypothetical protein CSC32_5072 [Pseudomonas aeruginosa]AWE84566.1 hypothetical protein CSC29_4359 [Pseudomonas aeruginosa]
MTFHSADKGMELHFHALCFYPEKLLKLSLKVISKSLSGSTDKLSP